MDLLSLAPGQTQVDTQAHCQIGDPGGMRLRVPVARIKRLCGELQGLLASLGLTLRIGNIAPDCD
jgi:hypothetical protein